MGRWEPDARGRLARSALELYAERGYEQTTVAEIAERAGLTARTFFRHFADKREVLFAGSDELATVLTTAVAEADASAGPLECVAAAFDAVAALIGGNHAFSRRRQAVIGANENLLERELAKMASWSRTLTEALVARAVDRPLAELAAETGVTVFRVAFERWVSGPADARLEDALHEAFAALHGLTRV